MRDIQKNEKQPDGQAEQRERERERERDDRKHPALVTSLGIAGLLLALLVISLVPIGGTSRERASAWASSPWAFRPTTVDDLGALPAAYRKAIVSAMAPIERAEVWREHLSRFAETDGLTSAQSAVVHAIAGALTPEMFARDRTAESEAQLQGLCEQAASALDPVHRTVFSTIGDIGNPGTRATIAGLAVSVLETAASLSHRWFSAEAEELICECHIGSWCSCWSCDSLPELCIPDWSGDDCGCFLAFKCDGKCQSD